MRIRIRCGGEILKKNNVLRNKNETKILLTCSCTCGEGVVIDYDFADKEVVISAINSNWYRDQYGVFDIFKKKLSRIWNIICGKDYQYSEIIISMDEWHEFLKDEIINISKNREENLE